MEWVLVIAMYAGIWASGDSTALTNVPGFTSKEECTAAGNASKELASGTKKEVKFVCVYKTVKES